MNSFDKKIGVANGYIGRQIKNNASIGSDIIEKIYCEYTDINLEWLITGEGEMLKKAKNESGVKVIDNDYFYKRFEELVRENERLTAENKQLKKERSSHCHAYGMVAEPEAELKRKK